MFRTKKHMGSAGQATVEAAFMLPVVMLLLLMLMQPGIVLYDIMVMRGAAAEGCRLLMTAAPGDDASCEAYVRRRLAAVPQHDLFHVHGQACTWNIEFLGDSSSFEVTTRIENELQPLPLLNVGASLFGMTNERGNLVIQTSITLPVQPSWVSESAGGHTAEGWVGAWIS